MDDKARNGFDWIDFFNPHEDFALSNSGFERIVQGIFGNKRSVESQYLFGGSKDDRDRAFITSFHRIL